MKKLLFTCITLICTLGIFIVPAAATVDPATRIAELDQQISTLSTQYDQLKAQRGANQFNEAAIFMAKVVQTSPQYVVEGGNFSAAGILGLGTPYYVIENPQDGKLILGAYCGNHALGEKINIQIGNQMSTATVLKPLPAEMVDLDKRIATINEQLEALRAERSQQQAAVHANKATYTDILKAHSTNADTDIIFQLNNPYMMVYGEFRDIEAGNMNAKPVAVNGTTMVPIRAVMDAAGGTTFWFQSNLEANLIYGSKTVVLHLGDTTATVNGAPVTMSVAPQAIGGKTMIPLRFISETMGMKVEWIQSDSVIKIVCPKNWADNLDSYCNDLGNGTKEFYDKGISCKYVLPTGCSIAVNPDSSYIKGSAITLPGIGGSLTVSNTGSKPTGDTYTELRLTERQLADGITGSYRDEQGTIYVETGVGTIRILIEVQSDTPIGDVAEMGDPEFAEKINSELEKNYAALEAVALQIAATIESLAFG